jgi:hypothetical protein
MPLSSIKLTSPSAHSQPPTLLIQPHNPPLPLPPPVPLPIPNIRLPPLPPLTSGIPRLHECLFLETHEAGPGSGRVFHVTGTVLMGMTYSTRSEPPPSTSPEFIEMKYLGVVDKVELEGVYYEGKGDESGDGNEDGKGKSKFETTCDIIPVPGRQVDLRGRKLSGVKEVRRCGHWVRDVIELLKKEGMLKERAEEGRFGKRW